MPNYLTTQIPSVVNTSNFYRNLPAPKGTGSWLKSTISQPYFTPYDENQYLWPKYYPKMHILPLPLTGVASWLKNSISQPYFTPFDENQYLSPKYYPNLQKLPLPPTGVGSWLRDTIAQPFAHKQFIPPYDINQYIWPASEVTYYKPITPTGASSWLSQSIGQPYFTPYDPNWIVWNPNAGDLRTIVILPTGFASWG